MDKTAKDSNDGKNTAKVERRGGRRSTTWNKRTAPRSKGRPVLTDVEREARGAARQDIADVWTKLNGLSEGQLKRKLDSPRIRGIEKAYCKALLRAINTGDLKEIHRFYDRLLGRPRETIDMEMDITGKPREIVFLNVPDNGRIRSIERPDGSLCSRTEFESELTDRGWKFPNREKSRYTRDGGETNKELASSLNMTCQELDEAYKTAHRAGAKPPGNTHNGKQP